MKKILEVKNLKVHFDLGGGFFKAHQIVHAVDDISFEVYEGETLGIVGESGCGKSSLARALCGLNKITAGEVIFNGNINLAKASARQWNEAHKQMQFIFQDPVAALNQRMTVAEIIEEPLRTLYPEMNKAQRLEKVLTTMNLVGLSQNQINRYPQEFSGGQCQRIGIARALILEPKILICDESVSALDVSIKAQIINLLQDLQKQLKLTILFISHDLSIVKHICKRIMVMYLGNIMELGEKQDIYNAPRHPYTQALLSAVPIARPQSQPRTVQLLEGELPSPINPPKGCVFNTRCPQVMEQCHNARPQSNIKCKHVSTCFLDQ